MEYILAAKQVFCHRNKIEVFSFCQNETKFVAETEKEKLIINSQKAWWGEHSPATSVLPSPLHFILVRTRNCLFLQTLSSLIQLVSLTQQKDELAPWEQLSGCLTPDPAPLLWSQPGAPLLYTRATGTTTISHLDHECGAGKSSFKQTRFCKK